VNSKCFSDTPFVLLLTKADMLKMELEKGIVFGQYITDYKGNTIQE
jgi:hypothetical protein